MDTKSSRIPNTIRLLILELVSLLNRTSRIRNDQSMTDHIIDSGLEYGIRD